MSPRDIDTILAELGQVREDLARLEERMGGSADHEERIRKLEQRGSFIGGVVALVVFELQCVALYIAWAAAHR